MRLVCGQSLSTSLWLGEYLQSPSRILASPVLSRSPGTIVDRLRVPDPDANENGAVVLFGGDGDNFEVQPNGVVITRRPLDREMLSHYSFVLYARDNAYERRQTSSSTVHVQVLDLNDWAPVFIYPQREGMNFTVSYRVSYI